MSVILSFLQSNNIASIVAAVLAVFTFVSYVLTGVATLLQALGKSAPGWIGSVVSALGSVIHLLNGNASAAANPPAA